ncbi:complement component receptor 1-like protein [Lingula anatina]|uniref:Complement component receptor 1-like protein n=1 Tax=Lingula anatina TaxID=7574 RepID=A0A1S3KB62_LINAN|nr:complement component receptor 1-like protein [Lingula anatina]XP_013419878.1 complement component receptor 1-like protein [Lingula anatina]XP_013419879.1 complement component receptor 1-like protein [Lingula anatina]|eukprot:XP_013419877.1 complement component receptor 1-like protein [Lingula anatina]
MKTGIPCSDPVSTIITFFFTALLWKQNNANCEVQAVANATRSSQQTRVAYGAWVTYTCQLPSVHLAGDLQRRCISEWDNVQRRYLHYLSGNAPVCGQPNFVVSVYPYHNARGAQPVSTSSLRQCLESCNRPTSPRCFAVDWDIGTSACWHHSITTACRRPRASNNVMHYKLKTCVTCSATPFDTRYIYAVSRARWPGEYLTYSCQSGYSFRDGVITTTRTAICQNNGHYSTLSTCYRTCQPPVTGDNIHASKTGTIYGHDVITYTCSTGFELPSGERTVYVLCQPNGVLNTTYIPSCQRVRCHLNNLGPNTYADDSYLNYASSSDVYCNKGYQFPNGATSLRVNCQPDGGLSPSVPSCQLIYCAIPLVPNAITSNISIFPFNQSITIQCRQGFQFPSNTTTAVIKCGENNNFSPTVPNCVRRQCHIPATDQWFDQTSILTPAAAYFFEDFVDVNCLKGYSFPNGASRDRVTCGANGSFTPQCSRRRCVLETNDRVLYKPGPYYYGDTVNLTCQPGYTFQDGQYSMLISCDEFGSFGNISMFCKSQPEMLLANEQTAAQKAGVIGGVVAAVTVLLVLIVAIVYLVRRSRGTAQTNKKNTAQTKMPDQNADYSEHLNANEHIADFAGDPGFTQIEVYEPSSQEQIDPQYENTFGVIAATSDIPHDDSGLYAVPDKRKKMISSYHDEGVDSDNDGFYDLAKDPDVADDVVFVDNDIYEAGDSENDDV